MSGKLSHQLCGKLITTKVGNQMSRKQFEELADILHRNLGKLDLSLLNDIIDFCAKQNPLFNSEKFVNRIYNGK